MIKLVVGLGNPGIKYDGTRHNAGKEAVLSFKETLTTISCQSKFKAEICEIHKNGHKFFILLPLTFMNESGLPVGEFSRFYKIDPEEVVVVYDDVDIQLGQIKLTLDGSSGGHNGVASVINHLGSNFKRLKIGIGDNRLVGLLSEKYVLQKFKPEEQKIITRAKEKSVQVLQLLLEAKEEEAKKEIAEHNKQTT